MNGRKKNISSAGRTTFIVLAAVLPLSALLQCGGCVWRMSSTRSSYREFISENPGLKHEPARVRALAKAQYILANLKETRYKHWTTVEEERGLYELNCSGLACFIVGTAAPESYLAVPVEFLWVRPRAKGFYKTFIAASEKKSQRGWVRVPSLLDAKPGDFIAWRNPNAGFFGATGHIVMVLKIPILENDGTVRVKVMDSSRIRRALDTRGKGETGIGVGFIWFIVDDEGSPLAYHSRARENPARKKPIAVGRLKDPQ